MAERRDDPQTGGGRHRHRATPEALVSWTVAAFLAVTVLVPLVSAVRTAGAPAGPAAGAPLIRSFLHSLLLAGCVAVLGSGLALCTALVAQSLAPRGRHLLDILVCAPAVVPPGAVAAGVLAAAGNAGWLHLPLTRSPVHGFVGMTCAMLLAFLPLAHLIDRAALRTLDPRTLEGARMSGAGPGRVLLHVVLPHLAPAVALGATVLLVTSMSDPAIPAVLRGLTPNIAHLALDTTTGWGEDAVAARASLLVALPALLLLPVLAASRSRLSAAWAPGARSPRPEMPTGAARVAVLLPATLHALVSTTLVATILVGALRSLRDPLLGRILRDAVGAVSSTLGLSGLACLLCLPLAVGTVWATRSPRRRGPRPSHLVLALLVLPGTTVGIAFSLALRVPHSLGPLRLPALVGGAAPVGGLIGIVLMLMTVALPLLHLGLGALWDAVPRGVVESARDAGASTTGLLFVVLLPSTGLLVGALAAVALGRCLVSVVPLAYVTSPDTALVVSRVLDLTDHSRTPEVFLLAVLTASVAAAMLALAQTALGQVLPRLGGGTRA